MTRYLLPCSCGQTIQVEARQAGEAVVCRCGATVEVPTMLNLAKLRPADGEPVAASRALSWGVRQRMVFAGLAMTLTASAVAGYFFWIRPLPASREPSREAIEQQIDSLSPVGTRQAWQAVRRQGLDRHQWVNDPKYAEAAFRCRLAISAVLVVAVAGIGLMVAAAWVPSGQQPPGTSSAAGAT